MDQHQEYDLPCVPCVVRRPWLAVALAVAAGGAIAAALSAALAAPPMMVATAPPLPFLQARSGSGTGDHASGACVIRVLAMGDSLTEGFHSGGRAFHPYALRLRARLNAAAGGGGGEDGGDTDDSGDSSGGETDGSDDSSGGDSSSSSSSGDSSGQPRRCRVAVTERGRSGERVLTSMQARLTRALAEARANGELFDIVIVLGGTNDVGTGADAGALLAALFAMHDAAAEAGAAVVAVTLPGFNLPAARVAPARRAAREAVNAGLRARWAAAGAAVGKGGGGGMKNAPLQQPPPPPANSLLLDLDPVLPLPGSGSGGDGDDAARALWDDALHLTPAGYDRFGDAAARALAPLVRRLQAERLPGLGEQRRRQQQGQGHAGLGERRRRWRRRRRMQR